jgi:hypothetical protein
MDDETLQRLMFRKALARKKRKEREAAGEIHELNITAMMDMMTIILVFLPQVLRRLGHLADAERGHQAAHLQHPRGAEGHGGGDHHPKDILVGDAVW